MNEQYRSNRFKEDNPLKFMCRYNYQKSPFTPSSERINQSDDFSPSALFETKKKEVYEHFEGYSVFFNKKENSTEDDNKFSEDIYFSRRKRNRGNNSIIKTNKIKLNQINDNKNNDIPTIYNKENAINIKWVYKTENNYTHNLNKNETLFEYTSFFNPDDYINDLENHNSSKLLYEDMPIIPEKKSQDSKKTMTLADVLKEGKNKKKNETNNKSNINKKNKRIKLKCKKQNKTRQKSNEDKNMNSNIQLNAKKGKEIAVKICPENLETIPGNNKIILTQEKTNKKENQNLSKIKKPNLKKNLFITTTNKQKSDINNSILSKAKIKEKTRDQVPVLINMNHNKVSNNINQEQRKNCSESRNTGINNIEKEEKNIKISDQQFIEISKKSEDRNNIVKIKKNVFSNYYQKINSLIKENNLKLLKFNHKKIESIAIGDNLDLCNVPMKDIIPIISDNQIQIIDKLLENYKGKEVTELLEKTFNQYLKDFIKNDWTEFAKGIKEKQINFYIHKKYKNIIKDMISKQLDNDLKEIKKFIHFKGSKKKISYTNKKDYDEFINKNYEVKDIKNFENFVKTIENYENIKFDYDNFSKTEKKTIDAHIQDLKTLAEIFKEFFEVKKEK